MRTKLTFLFGSILVAAISVAGCSSDDDDKTPAGNGGAGGGGGSGGQTADAGNGNGDGDGDAGDVLKAACDNESDIAAGKAGYCPDNKSVSSIVSGCAIGCLLNDDADACTRECVDEDTDNALSGDCRDCYIALTTCGRVQCMSECIGDAGSKECVTCLCGGNKNEVDCYAAFNECSGLESPYCEQIASDTFEGYPEPDPPAVCDEENDDE